VPLTSKEVGKLDALIANVSQLRLGLDIRGEAKRVVVEVKIPSTDGVLLAVKALLDTSLDLNLMS